MRRNLWNILAALLLCILVAESATASSPPLRPARPNIVLVFADDLGYGDIGANGKSARDWRATCCTRSAPTGSTRPR